MARPPRFERGTLCLEGRCSIQLSYGRSQENISGWPAWAQGRCEAVVSPALLAEYHETIEELRLDYPRRKRLNGLTP